MIAIPRYADYRLDSCPRCSYPVAYVTGTLTGDVTWLVLTCAGDTCGAARYAIGPHPVHSQRQAA
jgi:hypothetical protein